MLLKYKSGDIVLFESTGRDGVGLCRWSTFLINKWHNLYDRYKSNGILRVLTLIE